MDWELFWILGVGGLGLVGTIAGWVYDARTQRVHRYGYLDESCGRGRGGVAKMASPLQE